MNELSELQQVARIAFASEFAFYLKAHEFHWNVEGVHFQQFHQLFGNIYEEVYAVVDDFAEKLRALGCYAPGSLNKISVLTRIEDQESAIPDGAMVQMLLEDSDKIVILFKMVYDVAEREGEHGFSNFLADLMDKHRKFSWMLRSVLK